jgi:hypothetical protein
METKIGRLFHFFGAIYYDSGWLDPVSRQPRLHWRYSCRVDLGTLGRERKTDQGKNRRYLRVFLTENPTGGRNSDWGIRIKIRRRQPAQLRFDERDWLDRLARS